MCVGERDSQHVVFSVNVHGCIPTALKGHLKGCTRHVEHFLSLNFLAEWSLWKDVLATFSCVEIFGAERSLSEDLLATFVVRDQASLIMMELKGVCQHLNGRACSCPGSMFVKACSVANVGLFPLQHLIFVLIETFFPSMVLWIALQHLYLLCVCRTLVARSFSSLQQ